MADWATSDHPAVQAQLDRLNRMSPGRDILGHERLRDLLASLGHPERSLPPTFHVAGTNGKGSTCTYLRGAIEASGKSAHVYTSPHLVRLNERIRVANRLISDCGLADALEEVLDSAGKNQTTFFEATTAAAFLAFSRSTADACIVEVGIGGRLDATNLIPDAVACGIAQLGIDHQGFLGDTLGEIADEKAGIAKPGRPLVTLRYAPEIAGRVRATAEARGANMWVQGLDWDISESRGALKYVDKLGTIDLPLPALAGGHQRNNAGLAVAMLRSQTDIEVPNGALSRALAQARWPARLSRMCRGPLTGLLPDRTEFWLDGAHNASAMSAVVEFLDQRLGKANRVEVVMALMRDKDVGKVLECFRKLPCHINAVPIPGYDCRTPREIEEFALELGIAATAHSNVNNALRAIRERDWRAPPLVLIAGSLYLAGSVLAANGEVPD